MAGRPRKPIEQKILDATYRADRDGVPLIATGAPVKPEGMMPLASEFWDRVVPQLIDLRIAKEIDSDNLAQMCFWWAVCKQHEDILASTPPSGDKSYRNLICNCGLAWMNFNKIAAQFGLSPSERAKLKPERGEGGDGGIRVRKRA